MHLARFPRIHLAHLPTPLERLDRLSELLGGPDGVLSDSLGPFIGRDNRLVAVGGGQSLKHQMPVQHRAFVSSVLPEGRCLGIVSTTITPPQVPELLQLLVELRKTPGTATIITPQRIASV